MRTAALSALLLLASCGDERPPEPTAEQADQLDEADAMLNRLANEEGPEANAPGPSNVSN